MVAGMHAAKEYSVGMALQFPDLPSLKSESAILALSGSSFRYIFGDDFLDFLYQ